MTSSLNILLIDYGYGNLHSIRKMLRHIGVTAVITDDPSRIRDADAVILPGVGAFGSAMQGLNGLGFTPKLEAYVKDGRPLLGICLGMQLLFTSSEEFGHHTGLNFIPGKVIRFPEGLSQGNVRYKVPHIGWNRLSQTGKISGWNGTILEDLKPEAEVYFVHSYFGVPADAGHTLSESEYGGVHFASTVKRGNVYGCQYHPEKSRGVGISIYRNFIRIVEEARLARGCFR